MLVLDLHKVLETNVLIQVREESGTSTGLLGGVMGGLGEGHKE